jgi:type I restriction enzyme S subunit
MNKWPRVRLKTILTLSNNAVPSANLSTINLAGVYSFGRGLFKRGLLLPTETTYKSYNRLVIDEFVISQPKAWEGAIARVTEEFNGWYLSPVFPTFCLDKQRVEPRYLEWFCKRQPIWAELQRKSRGIGARRESVSPDQFLSVEIPLPPPPEQRRIVARVESLAAKIKEASSLREEVQKDLSRLLNAAYHQIADKAPRKPLGELAPLERRPVTVDFEASYPQVAVRSFGRGTFHKPPLIGSEVTWEKPFLVRAGDILVSNIKAWEGAIAIAGTDDDGRVGSHRYLTCVATPGMATARFVCFHLLTSEGLYEVGEASPGSADRNRTLSAKAFMQIPVPMPEYRKQLWFDTLCEKADAVALTQSESQPELAALLPSILDKAFKGEL